VRLIPEIDLGWLLARLDAEGSEVAAQTEIKLIRFGLNTSDPEQMQILWRACQRHSRLDEECGHLFFVRLDSEDVRILRESQRYGEVVKETLLDPPPDARVRKDLRAFENGNIPSWVDLTFDVCLRPTSRTWEGHDNPDLTQSPGWQAADEELRQRIQHAARRYVSDGDPENEKWFGTNEIRFSAISGFQALVLLLRVSPDEFNTLPNQVWLRWIPIILQYPHNGALELKSKLLRDAYIRTPDEVVGRLMQRIRFDDAGIGYLIGDKDLEACWDDRLADAVLTEVRKQQLKPAVAGALLELLLRHESIGSRELAQSLVSTPPPDGDPDRSRALAMMRAMVIGAKDGACDSGIFRVRSQSGGVSLVRARRHR
jgi:predicted NACHT family NTPase